MRALPPKVLRELRELVQVSTLSGTSLADRERLLAALDRAIAPKRAAAPARKRRTQKAQTRKEKVADIRAAVFRRASGRCDYCFTAPATDLEHPFGRVRVRQSASVCLAVCRPCHVARTNLVGGAAYWWARIARAFEMHRLEDGARLAHDCLAKHEAKAELQARATP